jgi:hypothetical protein
MGCGESGAELYVMPNGVNTRVCFRCVGTWTQPLKPREPLPGEGDPLG